MKQKERRRLFPVIDGALQYKFLAMILFYGAITVIFMAIFLLMPDLIAVSNEELNLELRGAAAQRVLVTHYRLWPAIISLICILGLHSFRVFLRVIGPLYRMRLVMKQIAQGNLSIRLRFRKRDYLHREANLFNQMMEIFEEKWQIVQSIGQDGLKSLPSLEELMAKERPGRDSINQILCSYRQHLENLMDKTKYFQLTVKEEKKQES